MALPIRECLILFLPKKIGANKWIHTSTVVMDAHFFHSKLNPGISVHRRESRVESRVEMCIQQYSFYADMFQAQVCLHFSGPSVFMPLYKKCIPVSEERLFSHRFMSDIWLHCWVVLPLLNGSQPFCIQPH